MIHHTAGVYSDGSFKTNGVPSEGLAAHIRYNLDMRPGRAFFVDGVCLHTAGLNAESVKTLEEKFKAMKATRDTQPYV